MAGAGAAAAPPVAAWIEGVGAGEPGGIGVSKCVAGTGSRGVLAATGAATRCGAGADAQPGSVLVAGCTDAGGCACGKESPREASRSATNEVSSVGSS